MSRFDESFDIDFQRRDVHGTLIHPETGLPYLWSFAKGASSPFSQLCIELLRAHNPSFCYVSDRTLSRLGREGEKIKREVAHLPSSDRSSAVRFCLIHEFGGCWIDPHSLAVKPVDLVHRLSTREFIGVHNPHLERGDGKYLLGSPFGGQPGNAIVERALQAYRRPTDTTYAGSWPPPSRVLAEAWRATPQVDQDARYERVHHTLHSPVSWQDAPKTYTRIAADTSHDRNPFWSSQAQLFHLPWSVARRFARCSIEELLDGSTFFSFLVRRSLAGIADSSKADQIRRSLRRDYPSLPSGVWDDPPVDSPVYRRFVAAWYGWRQ